jgi:hypothetical protein
MIGDIPVTILRVPPYLDGGVLVGVVVWVGEVGEIEGAVVVAVGDEQPGKISNTIKTKNKEIKIFFIIDPFSLISSRS